MLDESPIAPVSARDDTRRVCAVATIVGALVVGVALPILVRSVGASSGGFTGIEGMFAFAYVTLGFGIMIRREAARQIFVWLMMLGLVLICLQALGGGYSGGGFLLRAAVQLLPIAILSHPRLKRVFT